MRCAAPVSPPRNIHDDQASGAKASRPQLEPPVGRVEIFDFGNYFPIKWEADKAVFELHGDRIRGQ
ncbi:hypothetical protein [Rhodococcus jostii]|uniref:hypothetical protein n=1 Tax=Rhodococcus jostii TaxID=132919 RepID=UPI001F072B54|nr:hypothetical protein [Rhodococcus jostii]